MGERGGRPPILTEFYRTTKRHLNEGGVFVQWLQLYEIDIDLLASVLKAISENFADFSVYASNTWRSHYCCQGGQCHSGTRPAGIRSGFYAERPREDRDQRNTGYRITQGWIKRPTHPLLAKFVIPANSDYFPVLDQNAARCRFLGSSAEQFSEFTNFPLPVQDFLGSRFVRKQSARKLLSPRIIYCKCRWHFRQWNCVIIYWQDIGPRNIRAFLKFKGKLR